LKGWIQTSFFSWDITNILQDYLGYGYSDIPEMYYKYGSTIR